MTVCTVKIESYPDDIEVVIRNLLNSFKFPKGDKYFSLTDWKVIKWVGFTVSKVSRVQQYGVEGHMGWFCIETVSREWWIDGVI